VAAAAWAVEDTEMAYVPPSWKDINQNATEIQKRQRLAKALRASQEEFKAIRTKERRQELTPTQHGGLYETVSMLAPESILGTVAQVGGGLLGEYLTGKKAKKTEDESEAMRYSEILRTVQQMTDPNAPKATGPADLNEALGIQAAPPPAPPVAPVQAMGGGLAAAGFPGAAPPPAPGIAPGMGGGLAAAGIPPETPPAPPADLMAALGQPPSSGVAAGMEAALPQDPTPTKETLRAYLGLLGGPDLKDLGITDPSQLKTHAMVKLDNGNLGIVTNDPTNPVIDTKQKYAPQAFQLTEEGMPPGTIKMVNGVPTFIPAIQGQAGTATGGVQTGAEVTAPAAPSVAPLANAPGVAEVDGQRASFEFPELPPEAQQRMAQFAASIQGMDLNEEDVQMLIARKLSQEMGQAPAPAAATAPAPVTAPATAPATAPTASAPATGVAPGQTLAALPTAKQKETGKLEAAAEMATPTARIEAEKQRQKINLERRSAAKTALEKHENLIAESIKSARRLYDPDTGIEHPGLEAMSTESLAGPIAANLEASRHAEGGGGGGLLATLGMPVYGRINQEGADAHSLIKQMQGGVRAVGFQGIVGQGAGSISNAEGAAIQESINNMAIATSAEEKRRAIKSYIDVTTAIQARWRREAEGAGDIGPEATATGGKPKRTFSEIQRQYGGR